jgi:pimeloyl-ACP methyl ester carboxylesterase
MVWVIFDRGRDVHDLYGDPVVLSFARRFDLALLLHGHCPGKQPDDHGDMNMEPANGLGPALLRALDQLADQTGHHELSSAKLIFMGFSGAGPLCARLVALLPDRTVAAILSSSGHYDPVGIDTVKLDQRMLSVPELILAGGADKGRVPLGPMLTSGNIVGGVHHGPLSSRTESHIAVPQMLKN